MRARVCEHTLVMCVLQLFTSAAFGSNKGSQVYAAHLFKLVLPTILVLCPFFAQGD